MSTLPKKDLDDIKRGVFHFILLVLGISGSLWLIGRLVPKGELGFKGVGPYYGLLFSIFWGLIMGALLIYGSNRLGHPVHHLIEWLIPHKGGRSAISENITEATIVALSLILADQFKEIFEKLSNRTIDVPFGQRLAGLIIGRGIVILISILSLLREDHY